LFIVSENSENMYIDFLDVWKFQKVCIVVKPQRII